MGNRAEITEHACSIELFKMEDAKGVGAYTKEEKKSIFYKYSFSFNMKSTIQFFIGWMLKLESRWIAQKYKLEQLKESQKGGTRMNLTKIPTIIKWNETTFECSLWISITYNTTIWHITNTAAEKMLRRI